MKKRNGKYAFGLSFMLGIIAVAILALCLVLICEGFGWFSLFGNEENFSDALAIIGISFSVTFITTSLLGGLSDKSEKIYWLNYPEHYLINSFLNFNVLSSVAFTCLAIQTVMVFLKSVDPSIREAIFLSAFIIDIVSIVILTYKFTAVFFTRKRLLKKAELRFKKLIETPEEEEELYQAVVGIFNNTIEAAGREGSDLERIKENISLLLKYDQKTICSSWLTRLIIEIGRANHLILIQFVTLTKDEKFLSYFEKMDFKENLPDESNEILKFIYSLRIDELKGELEEGDFDPDDPDALYEKAKKWEVIGNKVSIILKKIPSDSKANCIFWLNQLIKLPYDLLKKDYCYNTVTIGWDVVLVRFEDSIRNKDVDAYQALSKRIFGFLSEHPSFYYDDDFGFIRYFREQLGEELSKKTAELINSLSKEQLPYMIDMIESKEEKDRFLVWMTDQMAEKNISEELWEASKTAGYNYTGKKSYSGIFLKAIITELYKKEKAVSKEYDTYRKNGEEINYSRNIPLRTYIKYVEKMTKLLSQVKKYEGNKSGSSLTEFIREVVSRVVVGEKNTFTYDEEEYTATGVKEIKVEKNINCYTVILEALMEEEENVGLEDYRDALAIWQMGIYNYFTNEKEKNQKEAELLFFLAKLNKVILKDDLPEKDKRVFAEIMVRILTNPCLISAYNGNSKEIKKSLNYIKSDQAALKDANDFLKVLDYEDGSYSDLDEMYQYSNNCEQIEDMDNADYYRQAAEDYEKVLKIFKKRISSK
ncbi:MAG: hypothetical protein IKP88_17100 [Lachnospiraceae bacterium]|nr:hypothetical protein [Lachnospiraceae bacterium]